MTDRHNILRSAAAGLAATVPMTLVMTALFRTLPAPDHFRPLPPTVISRRALRRAKSAHGDAATALAAHFAYGAATGALYPAFRSRTHPAGSGILFGLMVWAGSYLGWLPATGLFTLRNETSRRTTMMILAHAVWGLALGLADDWLDRRSRT